MPCDAGGRVMRDDKTPTTSEDARAKARERMAAYRQTPEYRDWLLRSRELRRGLKEKYRRQAGVKPRDAQAAAEKREQEAAAHGLREEVRGLHDAHVKRFVGMRRAREAYVRRYVAFPERERARVSKYKEALADFYVAQQLRSMGVPQEAVTAELIEIKREALRFRRLSRQARSLIENQRKEEHETVAEHA